MNSTYNFLCCLPVPIKLIELYWSFKHRLYVIKKTINFTSDKVIIREVKDGEKDKVAEVIEKIFDSWHSYYAVLALKRTKVFIAEKKGRMVGFLEAYVTEIRGHRCGVIYYVGVLKEYRRTGIASQMVLKAEDYFKRRRANFSLASTTIDNIASRKLFKKLGYYEYVLDFFNDYDIVVKMSAYEDDVLLIKALSGKVSIKAFLYQEL
ncbi:MAG: hypothetical protein DRJ63_01300 [Thermoprotei archaeon]|nr:MAG: hypothetical protein DRJ63_01300 [Thermoprotei archaeon]